MKSNMSLYFIFFIIGSVFFDGCFLSYHLPMKSCIDNENLDEFISTFDLYSIDRIVLKEQKNDGSMEIIKIIKNPEDLNFVISNMYKLKCIRRTLSATRHELWFYKSDILHLKLALAIGKNMTIVRIYKPDKIEEKGTKINHFDLAVEDSRFCIWLENMIAEKE